MDARITKSNETYKLVNKTTGETEANGLGRIKAFDTQNRLWARGIKTNVVVE